MLPALAIVSMLTLAPATTATESDAPTTTTVAREHFATFPSRARIVRSRPLAGGIGIVFDVEGDPEALASTLDGLEPSVRVRTAPIEGGTRVQLVHPTQRLSVSFGQHRGHTVMTYGVVAFDATLRELTRELSRAYPEPRDLGAHLELWREAESAVAAGELRRARTLWIKLGETSNLDDLAAVRIAELYVISGHLNEASARLGAVSRRYPRSTGASIARLDLLALDALVSNNLPTPDQLSLAAATVDRRRFEPFAWLRAATILRRVGLPSIAIAWLPKAEDLPDHWKPVVHDERALAVEEAICIPALRGDPLASVIALRAWQDELEDHPRRSAILESAAAAQLEMGLHADAAPVLRELLRSAGDSASEARLVEQLSAVYREMGDKARQTEVVDFLVREHPGAPGLFEALRSRAMLEADSQGLQATEDLIEQWDGQVRSTALRRRLAAFAADLAGARGDNPARLRTLERLRKVGWDDATRREPQLAVALVAAGRPSEAIPLLRRNIGRVTDAELRDRLAFQLATAEAARGYEDDARAILETISVSGTAYGRIARVRLRQLQLAKVVEQLESTPEEDA